QWEADVWDLVLLRNLRYAAVVRRGDAADEREDLVFCYQFGSNVFIGLPVAVVVPDEQLDLAAADPTRVVHCAEERVGGFDRAVELTRQRSGERGDKAELD